MATIKRGSLVHVVWMDAAAINEWTEASALEEHKDLLCETVGFLVKKPTKKSPVIVVAATRSKNADGTYEYNAIQQIPQTLVKEIDAIE